MNYNMKKNLGALLMLSCIWAVSCSHKEKKEETVQPDETPAALNAAPQEKDSTFYGIADDFGMSTFTLITDEHDTLEVSRTSDENSDDVYGEIHGDLKPDNRYAMTTRDDNEALGVLINLSQLERFTKNYAVRNGNLVLSIENKEDTVQIVELTDRRFKYKDKSGKIHEMKKQAS